ncbi:MAG: hypothetical protein JSS66_06005 [Armatimonadetes bacterium]|nr:hypothetical protein [Armatimonadota bacterium]
MTEGFHRAEPSPNKIVFLDQPDGERVAKELAQLRADYDKAKSDLLEDYMARAAKVAPFLQEVSFHMYHPDGVHNQDKKKRKK